jgi:hypothetical protein
VAAVTLADFLATWRGLTSENRLHRLEVLEVIVAQVREIQRKSVSMSFNVHAITYDLPTDKVFVTGVQITHLQSSSLPPLKPTNKVEGNDRIPSHSTLERGSRSMDQ